MEKTINLTIYCSRVKGGKYRATFEEKQPNEWYGIKAERIPHAGLFGRLAPREQNASTVNGVFYTGVLRCPDCGNANFVLCHKCQQLSCWDGGQTFTCAVCGIVGNIKGRIETLSGDVEQGNGQTPSSPNYKR